jgi:hypothetical protein
MKTNYHPILELFDKKNYKRAILACETALIRNDDIKLILLKGKCLLQI